MGKFGDSIGILVKRLSVHFSGVVLTKANIFPSIYLVIFMGHMINHANFGVADFETTPCRGSLLEREMPQKQL